MGIVVQKFLEWGRSFSCIKITTTNKQGGVRIAYLLWWVYFIFGKIISKTKDLQKVVYGHKKCCLF